MSDLMSSKRYRTVLIGTGGISHGHIQGLKRHADRLDWRAVVDIDADRVKQVADEHDVPAWYTDADAMLEKEKPDFVLIATPPAVHCELSVKAMKAGAWVMCEKPLVASLAELDQIMEAEQQTGCYTGSVFQFRYGSGGQHLKTLIDQSAMGRPLVGECLTTWYRPQGYYDSRDWRGTWGAELGGCTMGHGIHEIDLFLWLLGEWRTVKADAATLDRDIEVEDFSAALVRFQNNARGVVLNSILCPREETRMRLDFQRATVELTHLYAYDNDQWRYTPAGDVPQQEAARWKHLPMEQVASHATQIGHFIADMDANRRPSTSGPGVRPTIEFISALYKSSFTGETVHAGDIRKGDPYYDSIHGGQRSAVT